MRWLKAAALILLLSASLTLTSNVAAPAAVQTIKNESIVEPGYSYYGITQGKIRQNVLYYGYTMNVLETRYLPEIENLYVAKAGYKLVAVNVLLVSSDEEGGEIRAEGVYLKDKSGIKYSPFESGLAPNFFEYPAYISDGEKIQGWLTFEIPENSVGLIFSLEIPLDNITFTIEL